MQRDRMAPIAEILEVAYRFVFNKAVKFASLAGELKRCIQAIVLKSACGGCGEPFAPRDPREYASDKAGNAVVVGRATYDTAKYCRPRCEQRALMLRCRCGRPLTRGSLGWLDATCSRCKTNTRFNYNVAQMDNLFAGVPLDFHLHKYR